MPRHSIGLLAAVPVVFALGLGAAPALAHPHVLVDAKAEMVFDQGRIAAVRHIWQFDPAFTAYAIQGLDADGDNKLSDAELQPLAQVNMEALSDYGFFTGLTIDDQDVAFAPPDEYWLEFYGGRLTLFFTLPVAVPAEPGAQAVLEVYDPEYFVAFSFLDDNPVILVGDAGGCSARYQPPAELDGQAAMLLSQVPVEQRELPSDLAVLTDGLSNRIEVGCTD